MWQNTLGWKSSTKAPIIIDENHDFPTLLCWKQIDTFFVSSELGNVAGYQLCYQSYKCQGIIQKNSASVGRTLSRMQYLKQKYSLF